MDEEITPAIMTPAPATAAATVPAPATAPPPVWSVRAYGERLGDYQMVSGWSEERGKGPLREQLLPPHGIIVEHHGEAVAASWLYLCYGIGVGFWEGLMAKPGISVATAREACRHSVGAVKAIAKANNTGLIKAYVKPRLAAQAFAMGFRADGQDYTSIITTTD